MQNKVLVIEDSRTSLTLLRHLIKKAGLRPITASSLTQAQHLFAESSPEQFLCAVVDFNLPDASRGEAIDFTIAAYIPTIVITGSLDDKTRSLVLQKDVVDYIPKENAQVYDYLTRLLARLEKNKAIGVLVVDDSRLSRNKMSSLLARHNFVTYQANSAEQGLLMLEQHNNIRLVIVDEHMPGMSGVRMVAEIRQHFSKDVLAVIGISSNGSSKLSARFIKSGANDYLNKPYCHEEFFCRIVQNVEAIEHIEATRRAANADYLTGLPNRRYFFAEVASLLRSGHDTLALAVIDLDLFKTVNDQYGHDAGDKVLKTVARLLAKHFTHCKVARFGGEEFCVFFHNIPLQQAQQQLEQFRQELSQLPIATADTQIYCSVSIGLTDHFHGKIEAMLSQADQNLYRAKANGRNQLALDDSNA